MTSYLDNGYDVIKYFAKFEKFIPHNYTKLYDYRKSNARVRPGVGGFFAIPYKIGSQNKLRLKIVNFVAINLNY